MAALARKLVAARGWWLLGVAGADAVGGPREELGCFAGTPVKAVTAGDVAALVCEAPAHLAWPAKAVETAATRLELPILAALAAMVPFVPVRPGTRIGDPEAARRLVADRGPELAALIAAHADYVQVDVGGRFDMEAAEAEYGRLGSLAHLTPENEPEAHLIARTRVQSLTGRRAEFEARLRRHTARFAEEIVELAGPSQGTASHRRLLLRRDRRGALLSFLSELSEGGRSPVARAQAGVFLPPVDFRHLTIASADPKAVEEARRILRVETVTGRPAIQVAYRRALERAYPGRRDRAEAAHHLQRIEAQYRLLDLVAEGQIRAARAGHELPIRLTGDELAATFVLRFAVEHPGRKAA